MSSVVLRKKILYSIFLIWAALFFVIKYQSPHWVTSFFQQEKYDTLNALAGSQGAHGLYYYLGRVDEQFIGPLTQLLSGLLFMALALMCFQKFSWRHYAAVVFGYLLLTKLEVLFFPLYGDAIGGPFAEAFWLSGHHFNYFELFHQPGYADGGPKVYMFSIYPTYLGMLINIFQAPKLFLAVNHVLVFAMTAIIAALLREVVRKEFDERLAVLLSLVFLYLPLVQSQAEAINMEMPCLFFIMLSAYSLIQKRAHWAGIFSVIAVLVKGIGILSGGAIFLVGLILCFFDRRNKFNQTVLWWGLGLSFWVVGQVALKFLIHDQHASAGMIQFLKGWPSIKQFDISKVFLISTLIYMAYWFKLNIKLSNEQKTEDLKRYYNSLVMFVFGAMWFALFINFFAVSPRYRVSVYPFMVFAAFYSLSFFVKPYLLRAGVLVSAIIIALWSSYGALYGAERNHVLLEQSLEYRNDLKLNQLVARRLEDSYASWKIVAPFITAQSLALKHVGYVDKNLDVIIYGFPCRYGNITNFRGIGNLDVMKTIFVGKYDESMLTEGYPVNAQDIVFEELEYGDKRATLFAGGFAIDMVWQMLIMARQQQMAAGQHL